MKNKLSKKIIVIVLAVTIMTGVIFMTINNKETYATEVQQEVINNNEDEKIQITSSIEQVTGRDDEFIVYLRREKKEQLKEGDSLTYYLAVTVLQQEAKNQDIKVGMFLPEELDITDVERIDGDYSRETNRATTDTVNYDKNTRKLIWDINEIEDFAQIRMNLVYNSVNKETEKKVPLKAAIMHDNNIIETENMYLNIPEKTIEVIKKASNVEGVNEEKIINKAGDKVEFIINVVNKGKEIERTNVSFVLPNEISMTEYSIGNYETGFDGERGFNKDIEIEPNETVEIKILGTVNKTEMKETEKTKTVKSRAFIDNQEITWDVEIEKTDYDKLETKTDKIVYVILGVIAVIILILGIYLIKRKVANK